MNRSNKFVIAKEKWMKEGKYKNNNNYNITFQCAISCKMWHISCNSNIYVFQKTKTKTKYKIKRNYNNPMEFKKNYVKILDPLLHTMKITNSTEKITRFWISPSSIWSRSTPEGSVAIMFKKQDRVSNLKKKIVIAKENWMREEKYKKKTKNTISFEW